MRRIINNSTTMDPNKILPMTYLWAREHYKNGIANNWTPEEIPMQQDVEQWKSKTALKQAERRIIIVEFRFFCNSRIINC